MTTLPTHFLPPFLPAISTVHQAPFSDSRMTMVIMMMKIILLVIRAMVKALITKKGYTVIKNDEWC